MFKILWFLFIATLISLSLVWILDHNGVVLISWLGYEAKTDILTALIITSFFAIFIFAFAYLLARILAMKFPNIFKTLFKKSYIKRLETIVHRHWNGLDVLSQLLLSLETDDITNSQNLQKKLSLLIKNPQINNFFLARIHYQRHDFAKSAEYFSKIHNSKFARSMELESRMRLALSHKDDQTAIAYGKQILSIKIDNLKIAKLLLTIYRRNSSWQEARCLINDYGAEKFADELRSHEFAATNCAIAFDFYHRRNFGEAIKYCKAALRYEENFLPALEILLKSYIKRGFPFLAKSLAKKLWDKNPHLIFAEIFDLANRKKSAERRLKLMKKFVSTNGKSYLADLAIALVAIRAHRYSEAQEFLQNSIKKSPSNRAYKLSIIIDKKFMDFSNLQIHKEQLKKFPAQNYYSCGVCSHGSSHWQPKCPSCKTTDGFEW